ncbi:DNA-binding protein SMUBP-2 isoform X3 [Hyalella azteca]|uniref:DNA helicase n=1 Tax=Hyalella azteca TaxID=294128 RepID=A0A8B7PGQ2_HYAAZ|nr:DNA-binding protein SMUBP-2 isoform X3 [Hyalella azteca]
MDLKANVQDNLLMETETTTAALDDLNEKFLPSIHLQKKGDHNSTGDLEKNAMESRNIGMSDMEMENKANNSKIFSESTQRCLQDEKKSNTESKPETFTEISVGELNKMTRYDFLRLQKKLYLLERDAENEREVMKTVNSSGEGVPGVLSHLEVVSVTSTRFGRICITFASYAHQTLPPHGLRKGDNVSIYSGGPMCRQEDHCRDGVVLDISNQDVHITIDEAYEFQESSSYSVKHFPSLENIKRILKALKCMAEVQGPSYHLSAVLFGESDPMPPLLRLPPKLTSSNSSNQLIFFNKTLDQSQQEAVDFVVKQQDLAVVHGPPGTGKTTTLIEIIRQHVKMGLKVLALAPSNLGVDNLVERLDIVGIRVVRIGHPARTTPATQRHTIDALMHNYEGREIVKDIQNEINTLTRRLDFIYGKDRHSTYKELGQLRKELNERQERMVRDLIQGADVVLCTLMSAHTSNAMRYLKKDHFGLTVIDECSQGTEASCYLSVLRSPKLVLAGDHQQLPPTVLSPEASALLISLMERVIDLHGSKIVKMLTVQYRMHVDIMSWSSAALYNNQLIAHESVSQHLLKDLPHVSNNEYTGVPLLLVDTSSCPGFEESIDESITASSRSNEGEASMVLALVQKMIAAGLSPQQVAVISPYSRQVKLVRSLIQVDYPEVEVQTVDGFQGREKEAVILTLVRSNTKGEIGFLAEDRRLNVAVTRARRHLSVVCDTQTLQQHSFLKTFVEYMLTNARVVRAEHMDEGFCWILSHTSLSMNKQLRLAQQMCNAENVDVQPNDLYDYNTELQKWKNVFAQQKPAPASEKLIITGAVVRQYQAFFLYALDSRNYSRAMSKLIKSSWDFSDLHDFSGVIGLIRKYLIESCDSETFPIMKEEVAGKLQESLKNVLYSSETKKCDHLDRIYNLEPAGQGYSDTRPLKHRRKESSSHYTRRRLSPYHRSRRDGYRSRHRHGSPERSARTRHVSRLRLGQLSVRSM